MHLLIFAFDHWIFHPLFGRGYQFWSGIAGCFISIGLIGGVLGIARHHNCHVRGCWRLGKHLVNGTPYKVCARHHPKVPNTGATVEHVVEAHEFAQSEVAIPHAATSEEE